MSRTTQYFHYFPFCFQTQTPMLFSIPHTRPRISKPFTRVPTSRRNKFSSFSSSLFPISSSLDTCRFCLPQGENSLKIRGRKVSSLPQCVLHSIVHLLFKEARFKSGKIEEDRSRNLITRAMELLPTGVLKEATSLNNGRSLRHFYDY